MYGPVGEKKGRNNNGDEETKILIRLLELGLTSAEEVFSRRRKLALESILLSISVVVNLKISWRL
jgi:hypothetical protein